MKNGVFCAKQRKWGLLAALAVMPALVLLCCVKNSSALPGTNFLGGMTDGSDHLLVTVTNDGGTNPRRFNAAGNCSLPMGNVNSCWTREYYASNGNGLVLYANGRVLFWGGNNEANFQAKSPNVTVTVGNSYFVGESERIERTWTGTGAFASGIVIREIISLYKGAMEYTREIVVENNTGATMTDVRVIIGGDTFFSGSDTGYTGWAPGSGTVYTYKSAGHGAMFFYGSTAAPADRYFGGPYGTGANQAKTLAWLSNTVSGSTTVVDTSYYLQWGDGTQDIADGGSWTIRTVESFTEASTLNFQILPPTDRVVTAGSVETFTFQILSLSTGFLDLTSLTALSNHSWSAVVSPSSVTGMRFGDLVTVDVTVTIPATTPPNTVDTITLHVQSSGTLSQTADVGVMIIVDPIAPTVSSVSPNIGMVTGGELVTISGLNFSPFLIWILGGHEAEIVSVTSTDVVIKMPPHVAGWVDLAIYGAFGPTPVVFTDAFDYIEGIWMSGDTYTVRSGSDLVYRISRDVGLVDRVYVDGRLLNASEMTSMVSGDGSYTFITLPASLLDRMGAGNYDIRVVYSDGFTVRDAFSVVLLPDVPGAGYAALEKKMETDNSFVSRSMGFGRIAAFALIVIGLVWWGRKIIVRYWNR